MLPAIIGLDYSSILNGEWLARFKHRPGGSPVILMTIGAGYSGQRVRDDLKAAREAGQVALVWLHPPPPVLAQTIFHPALVPTHPDMVDAAAQLHAHTAAGGFAVVGLHGEFEQWWKWGPVEYRKCFHACRAMLPPRAAGCHVSWDKAPFVNGPKKGGPMDFAAWEPDPDDYEYAGIHPYDWAVNVDSAGAKDNRRFIAYMGDRKPWSMLEGGFTKGDVRDPVLAAAYFKKLRGLWAELNVRVTAAPLNSTWGGQQGTLAWTTGRYVPGAHDPPLAQSSPPWPGSPKMCEMLEQALASGAFLQAGDPALAALEGP